LTRISEDELNNLNHLIAKDPRKALELLSTYEEQYFDDANLRVNRGGFLVDIGSALNDSHLVKRGIMSIHQLLENSEKKQLPAQLYNLANGYLALHSIARRHPDYSFDPDATALREAKRCYREALAGAEHLEANLLTQLRVNYGNCLSGLGRSVEAISQYNGALAHAGDHPMAWGNLGVELERFAFVARDIAILRAANEGLVKALADDSLEQMGESWARPGFEKAQQRIARLLSEVGEDTALGSPKAPKPATPYHQAYSEFCVKHELFLNFCLKDRPCERVAEDAVSLSLTTPLDDNTTYPRLARVVNEIKERYAAARLLLFEACNPPFDTQPYDEMTYFADNLDYAVYGIGPTKLKLAFEGAYNILDKLAFFINAYLGLGIHDRKVNFATVWKEPKTTVLRPAVAQRRNHHLYGLYDVSTDLGPKGHLEHLRRIRDYLTHRYLVLHVEQLHWLTSADGRDYHSGYRELLDHSIALMQLVRSAVIYLIAFIDQEERAKRQDAQGSIAPMRVPPYRPYLQGPQDSPI
jgi:tetratricopeptide (TPR) repeat protein